MVTETAIPTQESDLSLLHRYTDSGDPELFAEIVRRYTGVVYAASHRILKDEARAKDVAQETFFRLLRQPKLVTHSLGGWLHRSATHLAIDAKRSEIARRRREKAYWLKSDAEQRVAEPSWEEISPHVDQALDQITEPTRTLLVRHFLQGTPQTDLAREMNASAATISRKIKAGVEELQKLLRKKGIYVAALALTEFCVSKTTRAAPAHLLSELGKMQMVGPVTLGPMPPPNPPAARLQHPFQTPHLPVESAYGTLISCIAAGVLIAFFAITVICVSSLTKVPPAPQATKSVEVEQQIRQTGKTVQDLNPH